MPGWTLSRNASSEVQRALDVKTMGIAKVQELKPTDPEKAFAVPEGLDLADIDAPHPRRHARREQPALESRRPQKLGGRRR